MNIEQIELTVLSERTGIDVSRLQDALVHLTPTRHWWLPEYPIRRPGTTDMITAIIAVCATHLVAAGMAPDAARLTLHAAINVLAEGRNSLNLPEFANAVFGPKGERAVLQIGDSTHLRWKIGERHSYWTRFRPDRAESVECEPTTIVSVDIGKIRDTVRSTAG